MALLSFIVSHLNSDFYIEVGAETMVLLAAYFFAVFNAMISVIRLISRSHKN